MSSHIIPKLIEPGQLSVHFDPRLSMGGYMGISVGGWQAHVSVARGHI